jgi:Zn-dependent alcohol dehydrogenase
VDSDSVITHAFDLSSIEEAFRTVAAGEALKVMVTIDQAAGDER